MTARNRAHEIAGAWAAFHARYDLLLTPTMECVAFPLADWAPRELDGEPIGEFYDDYCHFCYPFNLTGPARRSACRWRRARAACRSGCRSPAGASRTTSCCAPRRPGSARSPGSRRRSPRPRRARRPQSSPPPPRRASASRRSRGTEAWSLDAPVRAGELFALDDGRRLRAVRAWSPRAGALEVSFQVEG